MKLNQQETTIAKIFSYNDQIKKLGTDSYEISYVFKSKGSFHTYATHTIASLYALPEAEAAVLPSDIGVGINYVPMALNGMSDHEYAQRLEDNKPVITKATMVDIL
jgi:hypothetical protein